MTNLLFLLTVVELILLLAVLAAYLVVIGNRLASIAGLFAKVTFGVRAIESQTAAIGPAVTKINHELEEITTALPALVTGLERSLGDP
ncbi:MAG TPA: hypothetical protein ENK55_09885 [Actinobacteria bacterium]|nr:hypothetical protein [Actinomycetota bacterium]